MAVLEVTTRDDDNDQLMPRSARDLLMSVSVKQFCFPFFSCFFLF